MNPLIKICGITSKNDYATCFNAGAKWVGMVYYPGSPRHLDLARLAEMATCGLAMGPNAPERVLLSVDIIGEALAPLIEAAQPNKLQLHGNEKPDDVAAIKAQFGLPVIKAIAVKTLDDLDQCDKWNSLADWLLFDAKVRKGFQPGGTGHSFDWSILQNYKGRLPWMLAGGLNEKNIAQAIRISGAKAIDVSSGVESKLGEKNSEKVHAFIQATQLV
jgi:phosphoribosylanthranilate isomerase